MAHEQLPPRLLALAPAYGSTNHVHLHRKAAKLAQGRDVGVMMDYGIRLLFA